MKLQTDFSKILDKQLFQVLKKTVEELNVKAFVIGGFVRDAILGREQKKDIDIVFTISNFACLKKDTSIEEPAQLRPTHGPREEPMLVDEEKMPDDNELIKRKHLNQQERDNNDKINNSNMFEFRDGKMVHTENGDEYNSAEGEQDSGNESDKAFINNAQTNMLPVTPSSSQDSGKSDISLSSTETPDHLCKQNHTWLPRMHISYFLHSSSQIRLQNLIHCNLLQGSFSIV